MAEQRFAQIISWLFHPLLMCTYATAAYYTFFPTMRLFVPVQRALIICAEVFVATAVLPALWTLVWKRIGRISSLEMDERSGRRLPLLIVTLMYGAVFYILQKKGVEQPIPLFLLGAVMAQTIALLITLYWKISLHAIGIGGATGLITGCLIGLREGSLPALLGMVVAGGLVCTARLLSGAHKPSQVYTGWLLGFATELLLVWSLI